VLHCNRRVTAVAPAPAAGSCSSDLFGINTLGFSWPSVPRPSAPSLFSLPFLFLIYSSFFLFPFALLTSSPSSSPSSSARIGAADGLRDCAFGLGSCYVRYAVMMAQKYKDKDLGVVFAFNGQWVSWAHTTVAYSMSRVPSCRCWGSS
jgi:hypothetical protein